MTNTIGLYHGTTAENYEMIISDGVINGPVYLTPDYSTALDYGAANCDTPKVVCVSVSVSDLEIDYTAWDGRAEDFDSIEDAIRAGAPVYCASSVPIN